MLKNVLLWVFGFLVTVSFSVFQRLTGPTYPLKEKKEFMGEVLEYKFPRSCTVSGNDCALKIKSAGELDAYVSYVRFKTGEAPSQIAFEKKEGFYQAALPDQPPAGKLKYDVFIVKDGSGLKINEKAVITRFKGAVPPLVLVPHVIFMFFFMFFSVKIFLSNVSGFGPVKHAVFLNYAFLIIGGFVFGPLTQYYAFGDAWTGFPFGHDLTDNKTLIMLVFWTPALFAVVKNKNHKSWINLAFAVTALVYLVPHSLLGSELDYQSLGQK